MGHADATSIVSTGLDLPTDRTRFCTPDVLSTSMDCPPTKMISAANPVSVRAAYKPESFLRPFVHGMHAWDARMGVYSVHYQSTSC